MDLTTTFGIRPFTRAQALEAGLSNWQWRQLTESGQVHRMRKGVYVVARGVSDRERHLQRVAAELLTRTDHFAVGGSAVALLNLPNPFFMSWDRRPVEIAGPQTRGRRGVRRSRAAPIPSPWGPVTDLIDTAITIATELPLPQALMVTDAVARRLAGTTDRFVLASERCRTEVRRRLTQAHDHPALQLANPAAESPAESFYRGHMLLEGLPEPDCGVPMRGAGGDQYFIDLLLEDLAIEVDGRLKYTDVQIVIDEKVREDDLRATGLEFLRPFVEDLFTSPASEMARLRAKRAEIHRARRRAS